MTYNSKKLIFVGHFDIGERFTKNTQILANEAIKEKDAIFCVLVGDMDLNRKVKEYLNSGINGIKGIYQTRVDCAKSECVLHQLPKTDNDLNQLIDISHYQKIVEHINNQPTNKSHLECIKEVVPSLIRQRIEEYHLPKNRILIITETRCRNRATNRIKPKGKLSWHQIKGFRTTGNSSFINDQLIANENRIPVCRGVMFAFFEYVAQQGFTEIKFYLEKRHLKSIFMGWMNYWSVQKMIPYLDNHIEKVKFILPQMIISNH